MLPAARWNNLAPLQALADQLHVLSNHTWALLLSLGFSIPFGSRERRKSKTGNVTKPIFLSQRKKAQQALDPVLKKQPRGTVTEP